MHETIYERTEGGGPWYIYFGDDFGFPRLQAVLYTVMGEAWDFTKVLLDEATDYFLDSLTITIINDEEV